MSVVIRPIQEKEYPLLEDFLYEAIFIPEGGKPPERSILKQPELQLYIEAFGEHRDDNGLVAEVDGKIVGAVWTRIMEDYGHVDSETPSFAISLYKDYRGQGLGTAMMLEMLSLLKKNEYKKASLAVQKANYAVKMYRNVGFVMYRKAARRLILPK